LKKGAEPETNRPRLMMRHPLARRFVAGVRGVDIARWRDERLRKVTPATVKRDLVLLGHVFEVARKEWGIYAHNPVRDIKLPPSGRPRDRRLQPGEEIRLFTACGEARNRWLLPMVQLAIETAMRQGELRTLPRALHGDVFPGVTTEAVKRSYMRAIRRASITGHKDLRMLRRYTHLKAEDLARKLG